MVQKQGSRQFVPKHLIIMCESFLFVEKSIEHLFQKIIKMSNQKSSSQTLQKAKWKDFINNKNRLFYQQLRQKK